MGLQATVTVTAWDVRSILDRIVPNVYAANFGESVGPLWSMGHNLRLRGR
jgi:hypothetical protein